MNQREKEAYLREYALHKAAGKPFFPYAVAKDSIMAVLTGCIRGRVIRASDVRQTDTTSGVNITGHTFRISGKKDVMNAVKEYDGDRVEIVRVMQGG